jgi:hypothetical protein
MLTRRFVRHQYGEHPRNYSPPPFHVTMREHMYPEPCDRAWLYGQGGLLGGAVTLNNAAWTGSRRGDTGYGYVGMDITDVTTWPRPFVPTAGMISYLNYGAAV